MNIKRVCTLFVSLLLIVSLAACSAGGSPAAPAKTENNTTPAKPAPAEAVRITLSRWAGDNADAQKQIVKGYSEAEIVVDDIDYENLKEKQIQSMSSSAEYDLIWVAEVWLPEYVDNGWVLPLDDFIAQSGMDMSLYSQGIIDINTVDGKLYALPDMMQGLILTCNNAWFEREGQKVPTTMDELLAVAKHFKDAGYGIAIPAKQGQAAMDVFSTILYSYGGDYFDANGNLDLTSEAVLYAANGMRRQTV